MAVETKDVQRLFIAKASFLAGSIRRQLGYDKTLKLLMMHNDVDDTQASEWSDDTLQCLLAGAQTLTGVKTHSANLIMSGQNELRFNNATGHYIKQNASGYLEIRARSNLMQFITETTGDIEFRPVNTLVMTFNDSLITIEKPIVIDSTNKLHLNSNASDEGGFIDHDGDILTIKNKVQGPSVSGDMVLETFTDDIIFKPGEAEVARLTPGDAGGLQMVSKSIVLCAAGTTDAPSLRIPHGAAPSILTDGDMWTTTAGLFVRINGGTVGPLS